MVLQSTVYYYISQAGILVYFFEYEIIPTFPKKPNSKEKYKVPRQLTWYMVLTRGSIGVQPIMQILGKENRVSSPPPKLVPNIFT